MTKILSPAQVALMRQYVSAPVCDSYEDLLELVEDLAGSLRDFGASEDQQVGSMSKRAAAALARVQEALNGNTQ